MDTELFERVYETIVNKESTFDGVYYTCVKTTKIVCRPSCRARTPKRENIQLARSVDEAIRNGFRPCKRCKPEQSGPLGPDAVLAAQVDTLIRERLDRRLTLRDLSMRLAISPFHLQRTYKRVKGHSPADELQRIKVEKAKKLLKNEAATIADIGSAVGFRSPSHFTVWFRQATGITASEYRDKNKVAP